MTHRDDDDHLEAITEAREDERMEAALARADQDTHHAPEHWRGMGEPS